MLSAMAYNYAVSSYAPSISTLLNCQRNSRLQEFHGIAAISQPSTPGQHPLPSTIDEAKQIQTQFAPEEFHWLNDSEASKDSVLQQMKERSWIHLACHGVQPTDHPEDSAFMLHDAPLTLRTIYQQKLPHAKLAFLSACQTATGDVVIPQESAHLAAGMLLSGYHTVIGTMWSIKDKDAPIVAEEFYKYLKSQGMKTEDGQAAYALHEAVARLRENVGEDNFLSWVPFVHFGV
jgi:CHAT domain-containing protein